jgi:phage terminase large subunit
MTVEFPKWNKLINDRFVPLINNKDRYLICYGGRGSAKSNFAAKKLIYRCLSEKYFRYILIRETYATIKDSSYQTIKDIIYELGLHDLFSFRSQPLEIHCINGNSFMARGLDDTQKIKSVKDPTGAWWEEDIPTEGDFITVTTSIRTRKANYLQEIFTINPEVEGNYQEHWFWKRFFANNDTEKSFSNSTIMEINPTTKVSITYTVHHSTYRDNRWIPNEFIAFLMDLKNRNPYYWTIYCEGIWGNKQLGGRFYKAFDVSKHLMKCEYNPNIPLHISFDFNVNPYMTLLITQATGKQLYIIDEVAMTDPNNTIKATCREFMKRYNYHRAGLFIYGDPSGKKEDVGREKGFNYFREIVKELDKYKPTLRVPNSAQPVVLRGNFINSIFASNFDQIRINIFDESTFLRNDFLFGLESSDGTKFKQRDRNESGVSFEKYHHFSDAFDYLVCEMFKESLKKYESGGEDKYMRILGKNTFNDRVRL